MSMLLYLMYFVTFQDYIVCTINAVFKPICMLRFSLIFGDYIDLSQLYCIEKYNVLDG